MSNALPENLEALFDLVDALRKEPELRYIDVKRLGYIAESVVSSTVNWRRDWRVEHRGTPVTTWDLMSDRDRQGMIGLKFGDGNQSCGTCGHKLPTEEEFLGHYVIPNPDLSHTGNCPHKSTVICLQPDCNADGTLHSYGSMGCDWTLINGEVLPKVR